MTDGCWIDLRILGFVFFAAFSSVVVAANPNPQGPVRIIPGLGDVHHPVSTKNKQAQQFFDQGMKFVYGFNHDEARRSFMRAAELDPKLAMAHWGVALTLGPNYNLPVDPERERAGYDAVQRAIALKQNASEPEQAYIDALTVRYSNDPNADLHALDRAYADAMRKLAARYPDDLDAATLFAESMMNLNPWKLWTADGKPAEGTDEIVSTLESVLKRDPNHLGANHYYIHAVEASTRPERALPSAARLEKLAPAEGHLAHMPSHIYARVGDHAGSARCNAAAMVADKKFLDQTHEQGFYRLMYYSHNMHFLAFADCMRGDFAGARTAADQLVNNVKARGEGDSDARRFHADADSGPDRVRALAGYVEISPTGELTRVDQRGVAFSRAESLSPILARLRKRRKSRKLFVIWLRSFRPTTCTTC